MAEISANAGFKAAAQIALQHFPLKPTKVDLVNISENVTFRVSVDNSNNKYVLRLHRPGYNSIEELTSERKWVEALRNAGLSVQSSLLSTNGNFFELVEIPGTNEKRYAGMTEWLEGKILDDVLTAFVDDTQQTFLFGRIGEIAAKIHNQATTWKEPEGFQRRRLDLDGLLGEKPVWGRFWDHSELSTAEKKLLLNVRQKAANALTEYGESSDKFSLIHSDLHPDNIISTERDLALIDFDDSAYGWHMYEIASALLQSRNDPHRDAIHAALLAGYGQHRPISQRDEDMLPLFLLIRGMAIIGWYHQRPEHTGSSYFRDVKNWVIAECETWAE